MDEIMIIEWIKLPPVVVTRRGRFEHWVWIQKHRIRFGEYPLATRNKR